MDKTEQTIEALREIARRNPYCEVTLKFLIHKGQLQGFDEVEPPKIKFRAKDVKNKVEDAIWETAKADL